MLLDKNPNINLSIDKKENKKTDIMNMVIFIDKEKLPEDVRKMIEEHLPKDMMEQLKPSQEQLKPSQDKQIDSFDNKLFAVQVGEVVGNIYADKDKHTSDKPIDNNLFAIQTGEVVGNIYADKGKDINKH